MPDRRDPADRVTGALADVVGVGLAEVLAQQGRHLVLIDPIGARGEHQHDPIRFFGPEDDRFHDLGDRASDGLSGLGRSARALLELLNGEHAAGGVERVLHALGGRESGFEVIARFYPVLLAVFAGPFFERC